MICSICGRSSEDEGAYLPKCPAKPICDACNYEKYLAKSDLESHRGYFERYAPTMDLDVVDALDDCLPGLGLRAKMTREEEKRAFANSFEEYYEYDIATVINEGHGTIDREHMLGVIREHARHGWKLHSVYSNELGKNAIRILGLGVNATACEDVLIFERRVPSIE